jgi:hypothetical protein
MQNNIGNRPAVTLTSNHTCRQGKGIAALILPSVFALMLSTGAWGALGPVVEDDCMQDVYLKYGGQGSGLNCVSNDVQIANVVNVVIHDACDFAGDTTTIDATFEILTSADRHDIGLYFAQDGGDALTGSCLISILPWEPANENCLGAGNPYACCTGAGTGTCPFVDLDQMTGTIMGCQNDNTLPCVNDAQCASVGGPCVTLGSGVQDTCGDITTDSRNPIYHTITNMTFLCVDTTGDGELDVAACVSWRQPGNNQLCLSPLYAFPGSPSKCECDTALSLKVPVPPDPCDPEPDCSHLDTECATFSCDPKLIDEEGNCAAVDYEPLSTSCESDGNLCTIDHCDGNGTCETFDNVDCSHLDDQCNDGVCNPATGACEAVPKALSTPCEADGDLCTIDHCNGSGACVTFDNVSCSRLDQCTDAVCNPATGACDPDPDPLSTPCESDGNLCTLDHCDGNGACVTFDNVSCSRIDQCTDSVCNPGTGACNPVPDPLSTPCDADGNLCTIDHCDGAGACVNLDDVDCSHLDDQCNDGVCNPGTGLCQTVFKPLSTPCEADGNCCTIDHCNGGGICVFLESVVCPGSTGECDAGENCNPDTCACENLPAPPEGTPCDEDNDLCTIEECDGSGDCVFLAAVDCSHFDDQCNDGVCNPTTGGCEAVPKPPSTFCDNGDPCTSNECDGSGNCVTVSTTDCSHLDDQCNDGVCNPTTGVCETAPKSLSTPCEADGNLCTIDHCDGAGACVTFDNVGCSRIDQCTDAVCNPSTGACDPVPDSLSTPCEADGDLCTIDHCDGAGTCVTFDNVVCSRIDQCNDAVCNSSTGGCDPVPDPLSTSCEADGNLCTIDHCDGAGVCVTFDNVDCSHLDDNCNDGVCDPGTGSCNQAPKPDSTACSDDGFSCTGDVCISGVCTHVPNNAVCGDGVFCTDDLCDPAHPDADPDTGCVNIPNHANCDDGVDCTNPDLCDPTNPNANALGCVITPVDSKCDDENPCTDDSCDHLGDGQCVNDCRTPGITCPDDLEFECDAVGEFGDPIVDDDCSVEPLVECIEEVEPGKLEKESTITRTCTVTNDCGNQASCQQIIQIVDTTPPDIECPPDLVFECDAIGEFGEPVVTDNCDPDPDVTVEVEVIIGDCRQPTVAGGVSPPPKTTTVRTFTATDGTVTVATGDGPNVVQCVQIIEIIDTTPPVIVDCPQSVATCIGEVPEFEPPTCTDSCGECTVECTRSDGLPLDSPVEELPLTITCIAIDECDNVSDACDISVELGVCAIPTMSEWGLLCMTLLLLALAKVYFGTAPRRRAA